MIRNVVTKRPVVFVYAALAVGIVGALSFTLFSSQAGPSEDAAWDLPYLGSNKTLHSYGMDGPMNYRFWPGQYESRTYAPSKQVVILPRPRPARVAQAHSKPTEHPATLTIGQAMLSVMCRYVGAGSILCRRSVA